MLHYRYVVTGTYVNDSQPFEFLIIAPSADVACRAAQLRGEVETVTAELVSEKVERLLTAEPDITVLLTVHE